MHPIMKVVIKYMTVPDFPRDFVINRLHMVFLFILRLLKASTASSTLWFFRYLESKGSYVDVGSNSSKILLT